MKFFWLCLCMLLLLSIIPPFQTVAQSLKADSLRSLLRSEQGSVRAEILYELTYELIDVDNSQALLYAKMGIDSAIKNGDSLQIVKAGRILALAFRRLAMIDSSLIFSLQVLPVAQRHNFIAEQKSLLNGLGSIYTQQGRYHKALESHLESLRLREADKDTFEIAVALNNIGFLFYKLKDYNKSLEYYNRSIELRQKIRARYDFEIPLLNAAIANVYIGNVQKASEYIYRAMTYCSENCSQNVLMQKDFILGVMCLQNEEFVKAEEFFTLSLQRAMAIGDERFEFDNVLHLIQIYMLTNRLDVAEKYLKSRIQKISQSSSTYNGEITDLYQRFYLFYEKHHDYVKMAEYQKYYITLKDSIFGDELAANLMTVQAEYLEKDHLSKLRSKNEILELKEQAITHQSHVNIFIGIVAILSIWIAVILLRRNLRKQRLNRLLDQLVQARTFELKNKGNDLQRACHERDAMLIKLAACIKSSVATIKGLCLLVKQDEVDVSGYVDAVYTTSDQVIRVVEEIISRTDQKDVS